MRQRKVDCFGSREDVDRLVSSLIEGLLLPLADRHGCKLLSEKTPENVLVFPELLELLPGAHLIQIVRDPRAVIASLLSIPRHRRKIPRLARWLDYVAAGRKGVHPPNLLSKKYTSTSAAISIVQQSLHAGFDAFSRNPQRVLTVVYERLVSEVEAETKRICDFLGVAWYEQMIHPSRLKHMGEDAIIYDGVWYTRESFNRDPDPRGIDKWKTRLSVLQQARVARVFGECADLVDIGLDPSRDSSPIVRVVNATLSLTGRGGLVKWLPRRLVSPVLDRLGL